jgi:short-subunit dehydrogenase
MTIAIVTGASSGIGAEFARQIAGEGSVEEIWLIARRSEPMRELSKDLGNVKSVILPADLTRPEEVESIVNRLRDIKPRLKYLVNSAGYGLAGDFLTHGLSKELGMVDLNVRALVHLCHEGIPYMHRGSAIINLASMATLTPMPRYAVYGSSKAFVLNFSLSLDTELRHRGIHCMAMCPGPVQTDFIRVASGGKRNDYHKSVADPVKVVSLALKHARKGKPVSIYRIMFRLGATIFPRLFSKKAQARLVFIWNSR